MKPTEDLSKADVIVNIRDASIEWKPVEGKENEPMVTMSSYESGTISNYNDKLLDDGFRGFIKG